jgi:hypothetical protein
LVAQNDPGRQAEQSAWEPSCSRDPKDGAAQGLATPLDEFAGQKYP